MLQNCSSHADGKAMVCLSPDITDAVSQPLTDEQLHVHLEFLMDGAKNVINASLSDFIYAVNPDSDSFYGKDKIHVFYMDENYLEITVSITYYQDILDLVPML